MSSFYRFWRQLAIAPEHVAQKLIHLAQQRLVPLVPGVHIGRLSEGVDQFVGIPRLGDVAKEPAAIDRIDHGFDVGVAGEDDLDRLG